MAELLVVPGDDQAAPRTLPANAEAEMGLLGAVLINNAVYGRVSGFLREEHFSEEFHRRIWRACATLIERGQVANPTTLRTFFDSDDAYRAIGGAPYVARLAANATTVINGIDYARLILDLYLRREVIELAAGITQTVGLCDLETPAADHIDAVRKTLDELAEAGHGAVRRNVDIGTAAGIAIEDAEAAYKSDDHLLGVPTGLDALDRHLSGFQGPDLIVVAGRTSMGKTAFVLGTAHAVAKAGKRVGIVSLEMSAAELGRRVLAAETGLGAQDIRNGKLDEDGFRRLMMGEHRLDDLPIVIDDRGGLTMDEIRAFGRGLKRPPIGLLVVDHLGLIRPPRHMRGEGRTALVTYISSELKVLAKELDCPVVALSQLNRGNKDREAKRPFLSDLRDSGSIEQDADVVILLHRDEYYHLRDRPDEDDPAFADWEAQLKRVEGKADIIVAKNRHGAARTHRVRWNAETMTFADKGDLL